MNHAAQEMRSVTARARTAAEQRQQLYQVAGGAVLAGMLRGVAEDQPELVKNAGNQRNTTAT